MPPAINPSVLIRRIETGDDRRDVGRLLRAGFEVRPGLGDAFGRLYEWVLDRDPEVSHKCSRIALMEGRVVGHALLAPRFFVLDGVTFPGGILAMVVVEADCQGRGIGTALATGHPFGLLSANNAHLGFLAEEDLCLVLEDEGRVQGAVRAAGGRGTFAVYEAAAESDAAAHLLLRSTADLADRSGRTRFCLDLPPGNRTMRAAVGHGLPYDAGIDPGLLVKLLDIPKAISGLTPLLEARLEKLKAPVREGPVAICVGRACLLVSARQGRPTVEVGGEEQASRGVWRIALPEIGLARAFLGTDSLAQRLRKRGDVAPWLADLVDVLFPEQNPFFWLADSL